ncbi:MAG: hypothetical protein KDB00_15380, partial [Planctomycetales bacterium]|nr:hypothetical protein [Planctomycetales bacterium]
MVFLSVNEVSNRTGVRTDTIYLLIKSGKVESQRVGPKRLVSIAESDLHLIENRKTNNRVSGSDFGKDLFTAHEVAELTGVDVARLCELIRAGVVARADIGRARPTLIHKRELPAIAAISAVPGPGDPTQDEIRERCAQVQLARLDVCPHETRRRRALQLFDKTPMVTVRDASERLGCSAQVAALFGDNWFS